MKKTPTSVALSDLSSRPAPFPPRRDYASLSLRDVLDAQEAYHVYLSSLENVVATAVGRYRIHRDDWYATHPPDQPRPKGVAHVTDPRTLGNSIVRPWSWPAVLVFVREWKSFPAGGGQVVPKTLYLSDGRVVPTCVILAPPDESPAPAVSNQSHASSLVGGGYPCVRDHQGMQNLGTFGCLVRKEGTFYALTNRHVAGGQGEIVRAFIRGEYSPVGVSSSFGVSRSLMRDVFPTWPGVRTLLNFDAGLIRIDDVRDWTAQVFGIGEIGETFNATEQSLTLDLVGCPVRAFGGASGVIEGEIQAFFFRYESLAGYGRTTDLLIGPRTALSVQPSRVPLTQPGDSGTLWFYDPPNRPNRVEQEEGFGDHDGPERGERARRLRPLAMQWGGQRVQLPDGSRSAFALASFVSSICHMLEVDIVRDWGTGHDEYWGKIGHFAIGWKACDHVPGALGKLLKANQERLGFDDATISQGAEFRVGRDGFVPLADVPDYVWINSRPQEPVQHFADIDIQDIDGGPSMLERCFKDPTNLSAKRWKEYFDGFAAQGVGPEEGCLPFRVWQIWEAMVGYVKKKDVKRYIAAGGVLAHYVGDASQPLHCSWLHHGVPPTTKVGGRKYPVPRDSDAFKEFKKTREAKIHAIYEETMLEVDTATALADVDEANKHFRASGRKIETGHDAAIEIVRLMHDAQERLSPTDIINADDSSLTARARANALWNNKAVREATVKSLAESVRLLADLWQSAWIVGGGGAIAKSKLTEMTEASLEDVYRRDRTFVPSLSLAAMAKSGDFEPPA
jgi:hypothetical protein